MKPPVVEYERPETLRAALDALSKHGRSCKVLAGGYSLIPAMNARTQSPGRLVDIGRLSELDYIKDEAGELRIGALTTHNAILASSAVASACPILREAYPHVGSHTVRNRGTLGGSLCFNDPTAEMPLVIGLLGASLVARTTWGSRTIPILEFLRAPYENALAPNELLAEIRIPRQTPGHGYAFIEVSQRYSDRAMLAVGCLLSLRYGVAWDVRIGYRNVGPDMTRLRQVEALVDGKQPTISVIEAAAEAARAHVRPSGDMHADAEYRRDVAASITQRALRLAFARAGSPVPEARAA